MEKPTTKEEIEKREKELQEKLEKATEAVNVLLAKKNKTTSTNEKTEGEEKVSYKAGDVVDLTDEKIVKIEKNEDSDKKEINNTNEKIDNTETEEEQIRKKAYEVYEKRKEKGIEGDQSIDWEEAKNEFKEEQQSNNQLQEFEIQKSNAEKVVEKAREKYIKEYNKCKSESDKQNLIVKTKNYISNIFKSKENKKNIKVEDFFTDKFRESKKEYDQARIEMGNVMYTQKKAELEKAGLSGEELEKALMNYKATEILAKTIIDERQKIIDSKVQDPTKWKKLLDGYRKMPRWQKVAISTTLFTAAAGMGIITGGVFAGYGLATMATMKFGSSMAMGAFVGHATKGIDLIKKKSDLKFIETQQNKKLELKDKFSTGEIGQEEYEKEIEALLSEEYKRSRNRIFLKAGVGIALAGTAGYFAYDAMGNGLSHNTVDAVSSSGPRVGHIIQHEPIIKHMVADHPIIPPHASVEAVATPGQGAISTLRDLQNNLKVEYGDNLENAPVSVKHILETDPHKLAQEYGMYKPNQDAESAFVKPGSSFKVDESGNLTYHDVDGNNDITLERGTDIKVNNLYEGKMLDTDNSGAHIENNTNGQDLSDQNKITPQVNPNGEQIIQEENINNTNQVEDLTEIKPFGFDTKDHIISINENGSSLKMQFIYDDNGKIVNIDVAGTNYNTGSNPYINESELQKLDARTQLEASTDILKMSSKARFLDKFINDHDTYEYKVLHEQVIDMQKNIIHNYGDVIDHSKLESGVSTIKTTPENLEYNISNNLSPEVLKQIHTTFNENVNHLFPDNEHTQAWENVKVRTPDELFKLEKENVLSEMFKPFTAYLHKLEETTGLHPRGATALNPIPETNAEYMERALQKAQEMGQLEHVKLLEDTNIGVDHTLIHKSTTEEIIQTSGIKEVKIENLNDLKIIVKGYESIAGQPPLKTIMEQVSGKGLHSIISEDVAQTESAAQTASNAKIVHAMSSIKGKSFHDYYFKKTLDNGNIKLVHIKFYK